MEKDLFYVHDKVVVVTGAARGNGRAIAEGFLSHGAIVYFVDRSKELKQMVASYNDEKAHAMIIDLSDKASIEQLVLEVVERSKRIDVLINNAGVSVQSEDPYDDNIWDFTFKINVEAAFLLSKMVVKVMINQNSGGVIINITSLGAMLGFPNNPAYVSSKGALRQLTKAMARDFAKYNIRVNNICPGYILTDMTKNSYDDPILREERNKRTIMGRWGHPGDLVGPCIFLASAAANYITGIDLPVDGGWLANGL